MQGIIVFRTVATGAVLKRSIATKDIYGVTGTLPAQRSFSIPSAGQIHPSLPSGHPPLLLAANVTSPHLAVIYHLSFTHPPGYMCFKRRGVRRGGR